MYMVVQGFRPSVFIHNNVPLRLFGFRGSSSGSNSLLALIPNQPDEQDTLVLRMPLKLRQLQQRRERRLAESSCECCQSLDNRCDIRRYLRFHLSSSAPPLPYLALSERVMLLPQQISLKVCSSHGRLSIPMREASEKMGLTCRYQSKMAPHSPWPHPYSHVVRHPSLVTAARAMAL